jgi:hypothetical protein
MASTHEGLALYPSAVQLLKAIKMKAGQVISYYLLVK